MGEKVFVSWSGGKDSYLALLKGQEQGLQVETLLTFTGKDGQSKSHGLGPGLLSRQAAALGIPLEKEPVTWETYAEGFRRAVKRLKGRGITGGIFGDIHLEPHREWVEGICAETGLSPHLPLPFDPVEVKREENRSLLQS